MKYKRGIKKKRKSVPGIRRTRLKTPTAQQGKWWLSFCLVVRLALDSALPTFIPTGHGPWARGGDQWYVLHVYLLQLRSKGQWPSLDFFFLYWPFINTCRA
jgi:hypothetical protein